MFLPNRSTPYTEDLTPPAAELLAGNQDVRPRAAGMLHRALGGIPEQVRSAAAAADRLRDRANAGYFTADPIVFDPYAPILPDDCRDVELA